MQLWAHLAAVESASRSPVHDRSDEREKMGRLLALVLTSYVDQPLWRSTSVATRNGYVAYHTVGNSPTRLTVFELRRPKIVG